jgi:hypothetical protein
MLVLAALAVLSAGTAAPAAASGVTFAISDDAAQRAYPSELASAHGVGIGAARAYVGWSDVAPHRPAHPRNPSDPAYDWAQTDADMARYGAAGLAVWIAFWHTPAWASGSSDPAVWPTDPEDLEDFAYAVATRYPQVSVFMDWNEPNLKAYAKPNTIAAYEPMARAVNAGVKAAHPGAEVIAGNLGMYRDNGRDPVAWATALRADGVPMDALGIHPYPEVAKPLADRSPRLRIDLFDVPALARIAGVPVAVTEFGWSSLLAGAQDQAAWTAQAIDVARCTPGLSQFVFWGYHDHPVPAGETPDPWTTYGWLDAAGDPKPVYASASAALAGTLDCTAIGAAAGAPPGWPDSNTIPPTNRPPVCVDQAVSSLDDAGVSTDVACSDPDGDPLRYAVSTAPIAGALTQSGSVFTYLPATGFAGIDSFVVSVGDGVDTTPVSVTLAVSAPVAAPVVPALPAPLAAVAPALQPPLALPPATTVRAASVEGSASIGTRAITIRLGCPAAAASCSGRVRLSAVLAGSRRSLGTRPVTLAAGIRATFRVSLPQAARAALRRRAGSTVALTVRLSTTGAPTVSRVVRVRVPR